MGAGAGTIRRGVRGWVDIRVMVLACMDAVGAVTSSVCFLSNTADIAVLGTMRSAANASFSEARLPELALLR